MGGKDQPGKVEHTVAGQESRSLYRLEVITTPNIKIRQN